MSAQRPGRSARLRVPALLAGFVERWGVAPLLLAAYLVALALVGFWPTPVDRGISGITWAVIRGAHTLGASWVSYAHVEALANVLWFVPLGALLALALPRGRRGWALPIAVAASGLIELGQAVLLPARTSSLLDVLANSLGAALGVAAVLLAGRAKSRPAPD